MPYLQFQYQSLSIIFFFFFLQTTANVKHFENPVCVMHCVYLLWFMIKMKAFSFLKDKWVLQINQTNQPKKLKQKNLCQETF